MWVFRETLKSERESVVCRAGGSPFQASGPADPNPTSPTFLTRGVGGGTTNACRTVCPDLVSRIRCWSSKRDDFGHSLVVVIEGHFNSLAIATEENNGRRKHYAMALEN